MLKIEKQELEQMLKEMSPKEISEKLGCHVEAVRYKIRKYGIKRSRNDHKIRKDFFKTWSHDMAYILGFIYADGTINHSKNINRSYLQINLQESDIDILEYIKSHLCPQNNIYTYTREMYGKLNTSCVLSVCSKELCKDLESLGCVQNKTYEGIKFPNIPDEYIPDFIRGFFDGDGSIFETSRGRYAYSIVSSSKEFLDDIVKHTGVGKVYLEAVDKIAIYKLKTESKDALNKFFQYIYNGNFKMERKYNKFKKAINNE